MDRQIRALYVHDEQGRIVESHEAAVHRTPAPYFFLGSTRHGNTWRFRAGLPDALVRELARLAALERVRDELEAPPERFEPMLRALGKEVAVERVWRGPAFRFPASLPEVEGVRKLTAHSGPLVEGFPTLAEALVERLPAFAVVEQERAVSVAYCATSADAACEAVEVGVETLPGQRGRGLAQVVVSAWARALRQRGLAPLYSTSWDNRESRAVARKLGLILYGSDLHFR